MSVGTGWWTHSVRPERIITWDNVPNELYENGTVFKTDKSTFTDDDMTRGGWSYHTDPPPYTADEQLRWIYKDNTWQWIVEKLGSPLEQAYQFRQQEFDTHEWKYNRYEREVRLGITPTDNIAELDRFFNELCAVPQQSGWPDDVIWPEEPKSQALIDAESSE